MKRFIVIGVLALAGRVLAQHKHTESVYCAALRDSVRYEVYLPPHPDGAAMPVIYMLSYGAMDGDFLAAHVSYFLRYTFQVSMPNTIVVDVKAGQEEMGYSYETGLVSPSGGMLVDCIRDQIIPAVTRKYNASGFRTYIGHSQAASYGAYLFQHDPTLFNGYILLAPEKIGVEEPPFHLTDSLRRFYNGRTTFYYVAVGMEDIPRRRAFAREMAHELHGLDSTRFYFQYDSIARAGHNDILGLSLEFALRHIFQFYDAALWADSTGSMMERVHRMEACLRQDYGLTVDKTKPLVYGVFFNTAVRNKDTAGLLALQDYFYDGRLLGWNVMQYGDYCGNLGLKSRAGHYYELALRKMDSAEMRLSYTPGNLNHIYTELTLLVDRGDRDSLAYYELGRFSAVWHYKPREGLEALEKYARLKGGPDAQTNFFMGRNYYWLGDIVNARKCLEAGLRQEPGNKVAQAWLKDVTAP